MCACVERESVCVLVRARAGAQVTGCGSRLRSSALMRSAVHQRPPLVMKLVTEMDEIMAP